MIKYIVILSVGSAYLYVDHLKYKSKEERSGYVELTGKKFTEEDRK